MEEKIIPVLQLDDDNHSPSYVTRDNYWYDADHFMKVVLCKPHSAEFKIKEIVLVDLDETLTHNGFTTQELFDQLDDFDIKNMSEEKLINRQNAFDYFWNTSTHILYNF